MAFMFTLIAAGAPSGAPQLPADVEAIVARHLAARGGQATWDALSSIRRTCRADSFVIAATWAGDSVRLDQFETEGGAQESRAASGAGGWTQTAGHASQPLSGDAIAALKNTAAMGFELFVRRALGVTIALAGEEQVDGRPAHKLTLTHPAAARIDLLLDKETGLEVARVRHIVMPDGAASESRSRVRDHRAAGGVLFPHAIGLCAAEWAANVDAPASLFARPR